MQVFFGKSGALIQSKNSHDQKFDIINVIQRDLYLVTTIYLFLVMRFFIDTHKGYRNNKEKKNIIIIA